MKKNISFLYLFILSFIFRFVFLQELFFFGMDQEYEVYLAQKILSLENFPLIGVNASDTGIYLGPFFIYLTAIVLKVFSQDPLGFAVFASGAGVVSTLLTYLVFKSVFGQKTGFFTAIIHAVSYLAIFYGRQYWNVTGVYILSILLFFTAYSFMKKGRVVYLYLFSFFLALSFSVHLSLFIYLPLFLYLSVRMMNTHGFKNILVSGVIFFTVISPNILFDFTHGFTNLKAIGRVADFGRKEKLNGSFFRQRYSEFVQTAGRFYWFPKGEDLLSSSGQCRDISHLRKGGLLTGYLFLAFLAYAFFIYLKNKAQEKNETRLILKYLALTTFLFLVLYPGEIFEYYFIYLFPFFALMGGFILSGLWQSKAGKKAVFIILIFMIFYNADLLGVNSYSVSYKDKKESALQVKAKIKNGSYSLEVLGGCKRFGGYRYIFEHVLGKPPHTSYMDPYFAWIYGRKEGGVEYIVLLDIDDRESADYSGYARQKDIIKFLEMGELILKEQAGKIGVYLIRVNSRYYANDFI